MLMSDKKEKNYNFRAMIPSLLRYTGIVGGIVAILAVGLGFYLATTKKEFRGKEFPANLSENVVGVIKGYERKETENGVLKFFLKADVAKTFDDNHQELENISLQLYKDGDINVFDRIDSGKAIYIPEKDSKEFTIYFAGDVRIKTHDELEVETDQLNYKSKEDIAYAEESVAFKRKNISGTAYGAKVNIGGKTVELQKDVVVLAYASNIEGDVDLDVKRATLKAGYAFVDGENETIRLRQTVKINLVPDNKGEIRQPTDIESERALVNFVDREIKRIELEGGVKVRQDPIGNQPSWMKTQSERAEVLVDKEVDRLSLIGGVIIETNRGGGKPLKATSDSAVYLREERKYELRDNVNITGVNQDRPMRASAANAVYNELKREIILEGGAEVEQGTELVKGAVITAKLSLNKNVEFAKAEKNAYLKQNADGRFSEIQSDTLHAWFSGGKLITKAQARGETRILVVPDNKAEYSRFRMNTPRGMDVEFSNTGNLKAMNTLGRSTLNLDAGAKGSSDSAKRLTADTVKTVFRPQGNELAKAHAIGNAELIVEPKSAAGGDFNSVVTSPRFDCDFFPGNVARNCVSTKRTHVKRTAISGNRPVQYLESDRMSSNFENESGNISSFEASGNSKFTEGDKNGIAERMVYSSSDETIRFRGGTPTFWDSRARAKASSIDWNTKAGYSQLSGSVSTTYYNQIQTGNSTPFSDSRSPVYVTADSARIDHKKREAIYTGNARTWQEKNYVRGDKLYIEEADGRFFAEGNVQSVLYDAQRSAGGKKSELPVFVSSGTMLYLRERRQLRYEKSVDIRQGPDRIRGNTADIFLQDGNTLSKSVVTGDVEITQPNRKATGDYAEHDAVNETILIKGSPAVYSDSESGSTTGKNLTIDLKKNAAVNSASDSKSGTGRIRSVYKVKPGRLN